MRIGFVGAGRMGSPVISRLVGAGGALTLFVDGVVAAIRPTLACCADPVLGRLQDVADATIPRRG